jgi:mRNA-degrading endonuclease RelE of RelBE toxin-antitoxin system
LVFEECFGRWRVVVDPELREEMERGHYPGDVVERFNRLVRELEEDLNGDPRAIEALLREPMIDRAIGLRRLRMGKYRIWFIVALDECEVVILGLGTREKFYDRYRKRGALG